jgi:hypothetical protein
VWGANRVGVRISPLNQYNDMRDSNPQALFNHVVERYAQDAPLTVPNTSTFYGGREQGCTDYPALTGDHVAPSRSAAALSLRRGSCLAPSSQLGPIPTWREPA